MGDFDLVSGATVAFPVDKTKRNAIKRNTNHKGRLPPHSAVGPQDLSVLNEERRRAILDLLNRQGRVLVSELSRHFETSRVTIRRDLEVLHAHGMVHRTHGGALPSRDGALENPTLREKEKLSPPGTGQLHGASARPAHAVANNAKVTVTMSGPVLRPLRPPKPVESMW